MRGVWLFVLAMACGGAREERERSSCAGMMSGDACVPVLPACAADEIVREGACVRVGITSCAKGFVPDPDEGCRPVLPAATCGAGEIAWLGETSCHPIAECGPDRYGSPPSGGRVLYVDALGDDGNDGSRDKPLKTINAALARVPRSEKYTIAIADGTYDEELVLDRDVELYARCPQKVTLAPSAPTHPYAITIVNATAAVRRLGIAGAAGGVVALDTVAATVEDCWLHDTGDAALGAQGDRQEGALLARHVLVERARDFGVYALGGTVTVESSVVRETRSAPGNVRGHGVGAENSVGRKKAGAVVVRASIVEKNRGTNVFAIGSSATVEGSLLRDAVMAQDSGFSAWVTEDNATKLPTSLRIVDSVLSRSVRAAVHVVGSSAEIVNTTMIHTSASAKTRDGGFCVFAERSTTTISDALCRDGREIGVEVAGGALKIERTAVLDFVPNELGQGGMALVAIPNRVAPKVEIIDSAFARVSDVGLFLAGAEVTVRGAAVRDVSSVSAGFGDGIEVLAWPLGLTWVEAHVSVASSVVERVARAGLVAFGATTLGVRDVRLECANLDFVSSDKRGTEDPPAGPVASLTDEGGSICACGKVVAPCRASALSLSPAAPP